MFELLDEAVERRDMALFFFPNLEVFRNLQNDARYQSLLRKMKLHRALRESSARSPGPAGMASAAQGA